MPRQTVVDDYTRPSSRCSTTSAASHSTSTSGTVSTTGAVSGSVSGSGPASGPVPPPGKIYRDPNFKNHAVGISEKNGVIVMHGERCTQNSERYTQKDEPTTSDRHVCTEKEPKRPRKSHR